jgi:hypothetical protein
MAIFNGDDFENLSQWLAQGFFVHPTGKPFCQRIHKRYRAFLVGNNNRIIDAAEYGG